MRLSTAAASDDEIPLTNDEEKVPFIETIADSDVEAILHTANSKNLDMSGLQIYNSDDKNSSHSRQRSQLTLNSLSTQSRSLRSHNQNFLSRIFPSSLDVTDPHKLGMYLAHRINCKKGKILNCCQILCVLIVAWCLFYAVYHTFVYTRRWYLRQLRHAQLDNFDEPRQPQLILATKQPVLLRLENSPEFARDVTIDPKLRQVACNAEGSWYSIGLDRVLFDHKSFVLEVEAYLLDSAASEAQNGTEHVVEFALGFAGRRVHDGTDPTDVQVNDIGGTRESVGMYADSWGYLPLAGQVFKASVKSNININKAAWGQKIKVIYHASKRIDVFIANINQVSIDVSTFLKDVGDTMEQTTTGKKNFYPAISVFGKGIAVRIVDFDTYVGDR